MSQPPASSVVIVGAGLIGSAAAYFLAEAGVDVTLVERDYPAAWSSGRNAGFLSLISRAPGPQLDLSRAGLAVHKRLANELDDFEFRQSGTLTFFFEEQVPLVEGFVTARRQDGFECDVVTPDEAREMCPLLADDIHGGIYSGVDALINPGKLVAALVRGAEQRGARVIKAEAFGLDISKGRCRGVRTNEGLLSAGTTLVAAGAWSSGLFAAHGLPLQTLEMRSQLALTAPCEASFDVLVYGPSTFHEYIFIRELPEYDDDLVLHPLQRIIPQVGLVELVAQRADGRLLLGTAMELVGGWEPTVAGMSLTLAVLADHIPALQNMPLEKTWGGIVPQTGDGLPVLDAVTGVDGLFVAAGNAFGAMSGPVSGQYLARMILGEQVDADLQPFRYDRPAITQGIGVRVAL